MVAIINGRIISYNSLQARGELEMGNEIKSFGAGSYHGGRPTRYPQVGEIVEVILSDYDGSMLFIRSKRS